tara:strand:+ start:244 stop:399 length:156 start_codon:yes stop_codon:yes gene_type:complete
MSKTFNELYFNSIDYVRKFKYTLSRKELINKIQNKYKLTNKQAKEMVDSYE